MRKINQVKPERTYALVVGIEKYDTGSHSDLDGPVRDALGFVKWLREQTVPLENILLFLSPLDKNRHLLEEIKSSVKPANRDEINRAITNTLRQKSGDLLFIFWGGHGIVTTTNTESRRLFFANAPLNLDIDSLLTFLRSDYFESGFGRQIFFVDACAEDVEDPGRLPGAESFSNSALPVRYREQFVVFATKAGGVARNITARQTGLFSEVLREELAKKSLESLLQTMNELTQRLEERFQALREQGSAKQTPIYFWYQDWEGRKQSIGEPIQSKVLPVDFFAYDDAWVGRQPLIDDLSYRLQNSCRILTLVGITGIGKTALAERLAVELSDWFAGGQSKLCRKNFDHEEGASDFASVAAKWLEGWGEIVTPEERKETQILLRKLLQRFCEQRYLVLIDSLEKVLTGDEETGWGNFVDDWWTRFFQNVLSAESCASRFIITSQDLPVQLVKAASHYENFWYRQDLYGLSEPEQMELFEKIKLWVEEESDNNKQLLRIGNAYRGHPLALRAIAGEIIGDFYANVLAYWQEYGQEIEEVEKALQEASQGKVESAEDDWKLDRFSFVLRRKVKSRLDITFKRLVENVPNAYLLLCTASVYRCPVKKSWWLKHLQYRGYDIEQQELALQALRDRFLVEVAFDHNHERLLGQHNLIRSVSISHREKLFPKSPNTNI
ncbi:caspase family protein [Nostoc sp. 2RC]|uniref:caspase family protein n=1 Tax=Nostoc sp. 2RC TaxID=2485484 RepID=UPI0016267BAA|nr:caspase family protein [Nostoc sp. 2RC]MBC1238651.1 caspase family protein [Nostoc sp. 2RC]